MKEVWKYKALGECCDILDAKRKPIKKDKRENGPIPYYGATGLLDYVKDYIFDETLVLLGEDGAKWGAGETSAYEISGKAWVNNHAHVLRPNKNELINAWLIYYLNYSNLMPYINGVTVPKLNQQRMSSINIPLPPLREQECIVDYLDATFAKIDALARNAEDSLNQAKALFQAALTKMMEPKPGWQQKKLVEELALKSGENLPSKKYKGGSIPVYGGNGIAGYHNEGNLEGENIIIGRVGALCGNVHLTNGNIWVTDNAFIATGISSKTWNKKFLMYELKSIDLNQYATKAIQPVISNKSLREICLYKPSLDTQIMISNILAKINYDITCLSSNLTRTLSECAALKQSILRKTFE
ncbi:MAG: restriction endonuclease subunit S [Sodaliphilus pleomorphus]|uniref:restriction endonuclease subunit S n=1 Tax=Sodaliphilus pleomorphus TaxID=2606626 RepID=UPI0023F57EE0|nr:restriction endonuclease subunit S [Sodaliphilus pleomorphus]MDD7065524.1 restriction endonuclease subunit S [Sodaliphilus pleomorphus]